MTAASPYRTDLTPEQRAQLKKRMDELVDSAVERFRSAVRPIYGADEHGYPVHIGSCVLLDLANGVKALLTAGHVIDWHTERGTALYVGGVNKLIKIEGDFFCTESPDGNRYNDRWDFAATKLPNDMYEDIGARFISLDEIVTDDLSTTGYLYTALGYPNSKNDNLDAKRSSVVGNLVAYTNTSKTTKLLADKYGDGGMHHLFLGYAKYSRDEIGTKVSSIKPDGMSGGPVLDVGRLSDPKVFRAEIQPTPRLAGMTIELWLPQKVLVATRLHVIVPVIQDALG